MKLFLTWVNLLLLPTAVCLGQPNAKSTPSPPARHQGSQARLVAPPMPPSDEAVEVPFELIDLTAEYSPEAPPPPPVPDSIPAPTEFFICDDEPRAINLNEVRELISYPKEAKEAAIEGKVVVRILLDRQGRYRRHIVLKDPHPILTQAVEQYLHLVRFTPGIRGGQTVWVWATLPFAFHMYK